MLLHFGFYGDLCHANKNCFLLRLSVFGAIFYRFAIKDLTIADETKSYFWILSKWIKWYSSFPPRVRTHVRELNYIDTNIKLNLSELARWLVHTIAKICSIFNKTKSQCNEVESNQMNKWKQKRKTKSNTEKINETTTKIHTNFKCGCVTTRIVCTYMYNKKAWEKEYNERTTTNNSVFSREHSQKKEYKANDLCACVWIANIGRQRVIHV